MLAIQPQRLAAGDQHLDTRRGSQQVGDQRRSAEHLFEVIQHQQHVLLFQRRKQIAHLRAQHQALCHRHAHELRVGDGRQFHVGYAIAEQVAHIPGHLQCQARLAHAGRTDKREQAHARVQQARHCSAHIVLAPDQRQRRGRQAKRDG